MPPPLTRKRNKGYMPRLKVNRNLDEDIDLHLLREHLRLLFNLLRRKLGQGVLVNLGKLEAFCRPCPILK